MDFKNIVESCDIAVKVCLTVAAVFFVDKSHKAYELQKEQADLQRVQVETLKMQAENSRIQAEQTKILADAQSVARKDDAALVQMIVELLFKQNANCRTEDQMVLINFLGEMNDSYNKVKLGPRIAGAFGKRRECAVEDSAISADAKLTKTTASDGKIPVLTPANAHATLQALRQNENFQHAMGTELQKHESAGAVGYVALGRPVDADSFANFDVLTGKREKGGVTDGSLLQATNQVYVRANRRSTDDGHNPIVGQIVEHSCVSAIDSFPNTRGQTWTLVKVDACPVKKLAATGQ